MPELEQKTFRKRQVAYKVKIYDVLSGDYIKDELSAGHVKLSDVNVSRVNIIATLVYKSEEMGYPNVVIDDGSGRISLRSFESNILFSKVDVGDVVLVIGKIREFNENRYIIPEALKKINNIEWANVRKLELKDSFTDDKAKEARFVVKDDIIGDVGSIDEDICNLIKKFDKGDGVSVDDIIKISRDAKAERILSKLLEKGDIFEIKPGKIKVLE